MSMAITPACLIAFYLPQFHPIPENDAWWGKGFTEWTNVTKARPLFPGHYQPHLPADLGFYDLRTAESRQAQAELARSHGISGFCYYHYWSSGQQLLERPLREVRDSGNPDFPFCMCWANENWTRRWDGEEADILWKQTYSHDDDLDHINFLMTCFHDPRYIKVDGKPVFLIYRANSLPDPVSTTKIWREAARQAGLPGLYLCTVVSLPVLARDPKELGFDAAVDFQPDWVRRSKLIRPWWRKYRRMLLRRDVYWDNYITSYAESVQRAVEREEPTYKLFPCVTPGWDNSARRRAGANIFVGSSPEVYGRWLRWAVEKTCERFTHPDERIVFINAWNEWGEGNHLEPDQKWGRAFLEATQKVVEGAPE